MNADRQQGSVSAAELHALGCVDTIQITTAWPPANDVESVEGAYATVEIGLEEDAIVESFAQSLAAPAMLVNGI